MSGAEPCTGSNSEGNARSGLMLAEGATPMVPVQAGAGGRRVAADRVGATAAAEQSGCWAECAGGEASRDLSHLMSGYCLAIASTRSSQYGMVIEIPFDLVADVRCFFARFLASSKANCRIRSTPLREKHACWKTISRSVSAYMRPPTLEYSP